MDYSKLSKITDSANKKESRNHSIKDSAEQFSPQMEELIEAFENMDDEEEETVVTVSEEIPQEEIDEFVARYMEHNPEGEEEFILTVTPLGNKQYKISCPYVWDETHQVEDSKILDDERSEMRYQDLKAKNRSVKHYLNQIAASKGDKQLERAATFYRLAKEDGNTELAEAIKKQYPDIYASVEEIASDKAAAEEARKQKEEADRKAKEEADAKKPLNFLRANAEKTGKSPCYGLSDQQIRDLQDKLYNELVPESGKAPTLAGELLRAWNDLMYRLYNDGDWVERGAYLFGLDTTFSPRSVSNMKFLTANGAGQISFFLDRYGDDQHKFEVACERMLLNQIVKKDLDKVKNYEDSREYWRPHGRSRY